MSAERVVKNQVESLAEVDRARLHFDLRAGAAMESFNLHSFLPVVAKKERGIAFQCDCGRLGVLPTDAASQQPFAKMIADGQLKCSTCGKYSVNFRTPLDASADVKAGLRELGRLFREAIENNYMTLCWYFWSSLLSFQPKYYEVNRLCAQIFDAITRNILLARLDANKLGQFRMDKDLMIEEEVLLKLSVLNHVFEVEEFYDILLTLTHIAKCEHFLIGDDGRSIRPVGLAFKFEEGQRDAIKRRVVLLRRELSKHHLRKIAKLVRIAFNYELRNAFSHSEYRLSENGIYLTKYKRMISHESLQSSFMAAYLLQKTIFDFMESERNRFIESKGYEEAGWKIMPIVHDDGGFAIQITASSPGTRPTGKRPHLSH